MDRAGRGRGERVVLIFVTIFAILSLEFTCPARASRRAPSCCTPRNRQELLRCRRCVDRTSPHGIRLLAMHIHQLPVLTHVRGALPAGQRRGGWCAAPKPCAPARRETLPDVHSAPPWRLRTRLLAMCRAESCRQRHAGHQCTLCKRASRGHVQTLRRDTTPLSHITCRYRCNRHYMPSQM